MENDKQVTQTKHRLARENMLTYLQRAGMFALQLLLILIIETFKSCAQILFGKRTEPKNIEGQTALVTGGGNGLGKEICVELAKRGCHVAVIDIDLAGATKTAETIKKLYGVKSRAYKADVGSYTQIESLKPKIEKEIGFVDIIINNAGLTPVKALEEYSPEYLRKIVDVNLLSNVWTIKVFLPGMKERKRGHIVQIASIAGLSGVPISCVYSATKFGVRGLMDSIEMDLVLENLEDHIHMTTVFPYFITTNEELCTFLEKSRTLHFMPAYSASYVANKTVTEFLKNKRKVVIPSFFEWLLNSQALHPRKAQIAIQKIIYASAASYRQKLSKELKSNTPDYNQNITISSLRKTTKSVMQANENNNDEPTWVPVAEKVNSVLETIQKFSENVMEEVKENIAKD